MKLFHCPRPCFLPRAPSPEDTRSRPRADQACPQASAASIAGRGPILRLTRQEKAPPAWSSHRTMFTGTLNKVVAGPVGRSFPPMFTDKLTFTVKEVIQGDLKPGDKVTASRPWPTGQPVFPERLGCVFGDKTVETSRPGVVEFDPKKIDAIRLAWHPRLGR